MGKNIAIVGTAKYRINANDFWMFFNRSDHRVDNVLLNSGIKKSSWFSKNTHGTDSKARNNQYDPFDKNRCRFFDSDAEVVRQLTKIKPDYICLGNGSCGTSAAIIRAFGRPKILFSEYGWLPWHEHFYISRDGTGYNSEIVKMTQERLLSVPIRPNDIEAVKKKLDFGRSVPYDNFIYVPLQVDKGDFKFNFTNFKTNAEFVRFISDVVPKRYTVLVKNHPLNKNPLNLNGFTGVVDISHSNFNKFQLLSNMKAMMCINSTSVLEAIMFDKKIFTYGTDLFCNKGIVFEKIMDKSELDKKLVEPKLDSLIAKHFISLLIERQIDRSKCTKNNQPYIKNHYWNTSL